MNEDAVIDFTSIKSLRGAGIRVEGNSARRIHAEEAIAANAEKLAEALNEAIQILEDKAHESHE